MKITERIDAITLIKQESLRVDPPCPKAVKIELTSRCNYRCAFCAHRLRQKDRRDMDWGFYTRIVKEMVEAGVEELGVFYIGESFLCDWLPDAISYAKNAGMKYVFLTTNGSLATPEKVSACMAAGLDSLKFSMNFSSLDQFDKVAQVKNEYFRQSIENIKATKKARDENGYKCIISASSIRFDGKQQEEMQAIVDEILPFVDTHYWLPLYGQMMLESSERVKELGYIPTAGNQGRLEALRDPLPCWTAFTEGHITAEGYLSACCFDAGNAWNMGDLNQMSFMEAWNSEPFKKLRAAHLAKNVKGTACEKCAAYQ